MRFNLLSFQPTWTNQCHGTEQDRFHRILAYQNIDNMTVWIHSDVADTLAYVAIRYEPMGAFGSFYTYHVLWASELQRALGLVRNQIVEAVHLEETVNNLIVSEMMRRLFRQEQRPPDSTEKVEWSKEGF